MPAARSPVSPIIRYPGGKQHQLDYLRQFLPSADEVSGTYIEPFVGGAAVFLSIRPRTALLSDLNHELIDLYRGIRTAPRSVWAAYAAYRTTKREYLRVRGLEPASLPLPARAARLLYLNRTCFKGNWRHNAKGEFNVGYGGQSRRWVISEECLCAVSSALRRATIVCGDFEAIVNDAANGDYLFLDPPYRRGERDMTHSHYQPRRFSFEDHYRLSDALRRAKRRGVRWALTTTAHPDVLELFDGFRVMDLPSRGASGGCSGEALVLSDRGRR